MATASSDPVVRFGSFELDLCAGELRHRGIRLPVQGQPVQVLRILVERSGQVVTRQELREQIWAADTFVDFDHALNNSIASLRDVLSDSATKPRYIETLRRRGYRWIGPVTAPATRSDPRSEDGDASHGASVQPQLPRVDGRRSHRLWPAFVVTTAVLTISISAGVLIRSSRDVAAVPQIHSIAVLPLENLSPEPSDEYLSDGMTDELITKLAAVRNLRVISRTSVMRYKGARIAVRDIARALRIDALVEGSVVRSADRVRVNVQLIEAATDRHLWARSYEEAFVDVVRLQNRIASAIAAEIQAELTSPDRAHFAVAHAINTQAYEMYLKGRYHWNKRTESELRLALRYFEQSADADPQNAYAYVGLADTYNILGSWAFNAVSPAEAGRKAEEYARHALALDPSLGEAHAALGDAKLLFERNWETARQEFESAISLSPGYANSHHWFAEYLCDMGQFDRAIEESRKALELDPLAPIFASALGGRLHIAGRDEAALEALQGALELDPHIPIVHSTLGVVYETKGMFPQAVREFERAIELSHGDPTYIANLGHVYGVSGDTMRALQTLNTLKSLAGARSVPAYDLAVAYAGVNDRRAALRALKAAYDEGSPWLDNVAVEPRFHVLRSEPEFIQIIRALGLPILAPTATYSNRSATGGRRPS
ncbi:MAG: hypothetical protein DMF84_28670 [Acidobacteria bacterium]|nr:MAG: hypothetical protein DMF84_28670 [Acidobacteriota bacterium]